MTSARKGFRTQPMDSKKEQMRTMQTELSNMQTAMRITQMMMQQLLQSNKAMSEDLGRSLNQLYELQYKFLAVQTALNLDAKQLDEIANTRRAADFDEAAAKENAKMNMTPGDVVQENSTVVLTSTTPSLAEDKGIFRSRVKLSEAGVPALTTALLGKKVGDVVPVMLNDVEHMVTVLSIMEEPPAMMNVEATTNADQAVTH